MTGMKYQRIFPYINVSNYINIEPTDNVSTAYSWSKDWGRQMTGFYIRTERGNIELDQMSNNELEEFVARMTKDELKRWLLAVTKWIRDNVKEEPTNETPNGTK